MRHFTKKFGKILRKNAPILTILTLQILSDMVIMIVNRIMVSPVGVYCASGRATDDHLLQSILSTSNRDGIYHGKSLETRKGLDGLSYRLCRCRICDFYFLGFIGPIGMTLMFL